MRCSARRKRAAATISIARVILWMFLTLEMRFLTSFWVAIGASSHGSATQPAKTKPGKDGGSVAHLESARATEDAAWRRFAGG